MRTLRVKALALMAIALVSTSGLAACGGSGNDGADDATAEANKRLRVSFVAPFPKADPFFRVLANGFEQAGKDLNLDATFSGPQKFDPEEQVRLIRAAIAQDPDGIVVPVVDPAATEPILKEAHSKGIPVVLALGGQEILDTSGALVYVGQDEFAGGVLLGQQMKEAGVQNAICLNNGVGVRSLDLRCEGFASALKPGSSRVVPGDANDITKTRERIKAVLTRDPTLTGIMSTGPQLDGAVRDALKQTGRAEVKYGVFDLTPAIVKGLASGEVVGAIDQQPFLTGYASASALASYIRYGVHPVGQLRSGPRIVTKADAGDVLEASESGRR